MYNTKTGPRGWHRAHAEPLPGGARLSAFRVAGIGQLPYMCVYIYIYICICIHIHTYIHILHIGICTHTHIYIYI